MFLSLGSITLESLSFRARKIINICFNLYFEVCKYVHICIGAGLLICVFNCLSLTLENWKVWNLWLVLIQDFFHFLKIESFVISRLFCNKIPWNYFFLVNSKVEFHCFFLNRHCKYVVKNLRFCHWNLFGPIIIRVLEEWELMGDIKYAYELRTIQQQSVIPGW